MVIVISILAIALTTVTQMLTRNTVAAPTYDETKAVELAESLTGEIRSKRFDENSPVGGVPPCDGVSGASACTASARSCRLRQAKQHHPTPALILMTLTITMASMKGAAVQLERYFRCCWQSALGLPELSCTDCCVLFR